MSAIVDMTSVKAGQISRMPSCSDSSWRRFRI
jgi:hypothetical protein